MFNISHTRTNIHLKILCGEISMCQNFCNMCCHANIYVIGKYIICMNVNKHHSRVFSKGREVNHFFFEPEAMAEEKLYEELRRRIFSIYLRLKDRERNGYLFFDLDGVLIEAGLETAACPTTLEEYMDKHQASVALFKTKLKTLKNLGFRIAINTGRGGEFARRIVREYFPVNCINRIVCEGGAEIIAYEKIKGKIIEERLIPASIDKASFDILEKNKDKIINHALKKLNGSLEGGKEVIISLNAPAGQGIEEFFESIKKYLKEIDILDRVEITHSATAVDITPRGADKLKALVEVLGDDMAIYFGDAKSDEDAMRRSLINVVPANAHESTKEQARRATLGIVSEKHEIEGVAHSLRTIELFFRLAKRDLG